MQIKQKKTYRLLRALQPWPVKPHCWQLRLASYCCCHHQYLRRHQELYRARRRWPLTKPFQTKALACPEVHNEPKSKGSGPNA